MTTQEIQEIINLSETYEAEECEVKTILFLGECSEQN